MQHGPLGYLQSMLKRAVDAGEQEHARRRLEHSIHDLEHILEGLGHPARERALKLADRAVILDTGTVVFDGSAAEVLELTVTEAVAFFAPFDRQKDGHVDAAELVEALRSRGEPLSEEDIAHLLRELSIDGDKRINVRQFVEHMLTTSQ
mgnify:CR=1 FL=1